MSSLSSGRILRCLAKRNIINFCWKGLPYFFWQRFLILVVLRWPCHKSLSVTYQLTKFRRLSWAWFQRMLLTTPKPPERQLFTLTSAMIGRRLGQICLFSLLLVHICQGGEFSFKSLGPHVSATFKFPDKQNSVLLCQIIIQLLPFLSFSW